MPEGWSTWSARGETAPHMFIDSQRYRSKPGSLGISGASNPAEHGGWEKAVAGIEAGAWYRFVAYYRAEAVPAESWQVVARLDWRAAANRRVGQPDYVSKASREGRWTRLTLDAQAPAKASAVVLQLYLSNAPQGTVWWDDISLDQIEAPQPRQITLASINLRPQGAGSAARRFPFADRSRSARLYRRAWSEAWFVSFGSQNGCNAQVERSRRNTRSGTNPQGCPSSGKLHHKTGMAVTPNKKGAS